MDVVSGLRRGMGSFVKDDGIDHVLVCGNVKWEYLKTFVQEFFADDGNSYTKVVVMCNRANWTEELWNSFFTSRTKYQSNVVYLEGSCMTRDDLTRAQVETSLAVFVLNNQHDPQPFTEDSETLKRILTVRRKHSHLFNVRIAGLDATNYRCARTPRGKCRRWWRTRNVAV
jgi:hypothetical protein